VNQGGRVDTRHMNDEDSAIAERWNAEKFVLFGRIAHKDVNRYGAYWCQLSNEAFALAAAERAARAERMWKNRTWRTTEEKRAA